jgi:hypothetical protein
VLYPERGEPQYIRSETTGHRSSAESKDDVEGMVLEKTYLAEKAITMVNSFFYHFLQLRCSSKWNEGVVPDIKRWIESDPNTKMASETID